MTELTWQNDDDVTACHLCDSPYSFLNRRHHCRKCGKVVCSSCSNQEITYLPNTQVVHANGPPLRCSPNQRYRTCDTCVAEIRTIRRTLLGDSLDRRTLRDANFLRENTPVVGNSKYARIKSRPVESASSALTLNNRTDTESDQNLCPVCAVDLLKRFFETVQNGDAESSLNAFETFKECHISECLVCFDFTNDHMRLQSPPLGSQARNRMLVYNIPPIPRPSYELVGETGPNSVDTIVQITEVEAEKNAIDDECVICLEDLKPGDKVGRLECLCVFHYKCIKDWFNKKSYGECPVHFLHR